MEREATPLTMTVDPICRIISLAFPQNGNDKNYEKIHRDVSRIQWFSIGHGGRIEDDTIILQFEQEEFNCCLRYLTKFEWKQNEQLSNSPQNSDRSLG